MAAHGTTGGMKATRWIGRTPALAAGLAAAAAMVAAPAAAHAQGWAPGVHVYPVPESRFVWSEPHLSEDGTAIGVTLFDAGVFPQPQTGAVIRPTGTSQFSVNRILNDVSDGGAFTTEYASRRSAAGVVDVLVPGATRPQGSNQRSAISGNGRVVAMSVEQPLFDLPSVLYRWTPETGTQLLGSYGPGAFQTRVKGISRDGTTIVGDGFNVTTGTIRPWTWREGQGFTLLPTLPESPVEGTATAVNGDGSIVVGSVTLPSLRSVGAVWRDGILTTVPPVPGFRGTLVRDLSDDGSILVGLMDPNGGGQSLNVIWTAETNWIPTIDYLRMQGLEIPSYYSSPFLEVSADGRTFAGLVFDQRTGTNVIGVFVVPSPGVVPVLAGVLMFASRRRRIRRVV
jgi:hypothetical protein